MTNDRDTSDRVRDDEVVSRLKQLLGLDDGRECVHHYDGTLSPFENDPRWWRCDVCGERFFGKEAGL